MSRERMQDLLTALNEDGWQIANLDRAFEVEDERIRWELSHRSRGIAIEAEFHLFREMDQPADDLRHIAYCRVVDHGQKLYFYRRGLPSWTNGVRDFVAELRRIEPSPPSSH